MKKNLILCFCVLSFNFILAQQSVSISGPSSVEVGIPYNYSFTFNPDYIGNGNLAGVIPDAYVITEWVVITGSNCYNGQVTGYIGTSSNQTCYYNNSTFNGSNPLTIPIQWGDGTFLRNDNIEVKVSGYYRKNSTGEITKYFSYLTNNLPIPTVERIAAPMIGGSSSILNCDQTATSYTVSNTTYANSFLWQVTNGAQIIGSSTGNTVNIIPPLTGNFDVICSAKRSGANPAYFRASANTITRSSHSATFSPVYTVQPVIQYMCIGSGQLMNMPSQNRIISINWTAPNCTINGQGTLTPTIIPTSSITVGSTVMVYADVQFSGGCIATTPTIDFAIYEGATPPVPDGTISFVPVNPNPYIDDGYDVVFIPSIPFVNGKISISPAVIPPGRNSRLTTFRVNYYNYCNGLSSFKNFSVTTPAAPSPCLRIASTATMNLIITPNPTSNNVKVTLPETITGTYQVFEQTGELVQESTFINKNELEIELSRKLKSGIYILKVVTETNVYDDKIILNR